MKRKPVIGITLGDPAGIGPEIIVKALSAPEIYKVARPFVIGERWLLEQALSITKSPLFLYEAKCPAECAFDSKAIHFLDHNIISPDQFAFGKISGSCGVASYSYLKIAIDMARKGEISAIVTAPISKEALKKANIDFIGHTEILSALTSSPKPLTMFETGNLRIFFHSRHLSLKKACALVKKELLLETIHDCSNALKKLGEDTKSFAVAALNPDSGEQGLFGDEEIREILPAVAEAKWAGIKVEGPISADSVFHLANEGKYSAVLSLYHDQGHIAAKTLDFARTISVTLGLPFIRTSVDHGTAFDIAGKNLARELSMKEAILKAAKYCLK